MIHLFVCGHRVESFSATARNVPLPPLPFALIMFLYTPALVLKGNWPTDQGAASLIHVPIAIYTKAPANSQHCPCGDITTNKVNNPSHYPSRSLKEKRFLRAPAWCEGTS